MSGEKMINTAKVCLLRPEGNKSRRLFDEVWEKKGEI